MMKNMSFSDAFAKQIKEALEAIPATVTFDSLKDLRSNAK